MADKKSIVAVDDSGLMLRTLERLLGKGYVYRGFSKGMRALKYLEDEGRPDLIILDIDMPEIDGYEMLKSIRETEHLKNVPVLFLTSNNDKSNVIKAVTEGINDYVVKPIDEEILMKKIHTFLNDTPNKSLD